MDNIHVQNSRYQFYLIPINLQRRLKSDFEKTSRDAERYLDAFIRHVNHFTANPTNPLVTITWITNIVLFYANIGPSKAATAFFQSIDLSSLAKLYQKGEKKETSGHLLNFLRCIIDYSKRVESDHDRTVLINSVFREIDLESYGHSIHKKIQAKLMIVNHPGYSSENEVTWASLIRGVANLFYKSSNLTNDEPSRRSIREKVSGFFSSIDFQSLGKLMDVQKKGIGPVVRVLDMVRKVPDERIRTSAQLSYLSGLSFKRLAESYNRNPIGSVGLANFCKRYSHTKESLFSEWKVFFETVDFRIPFKLAHFTKEEYNKLTNDFPMAKVTLEHILKSDNDGIRINISDLSDIQTSDLVSEVINEILKRTGFNTTDLTMLFQRLNQIFERKDPMREKVLDQFDLRVIGLKIRGKTTKTFDQLLRRLNDLKLNDNKYGQFIEGFGMDECRRLLHEGNHNIETILNRFSRWNEDNPDYENGVEEDFIGIGIFDNKIRIVSMSKDGQYKFVDGTEKFHNILYVASADALAIKSAIEELEYLMNDPKSTEQALQEFFERNQKLIINDEYKKAHSHIALTKEDGDLIPDFLLEPLDQNSLCDILDLKLPTAKIHILQKNRIRYSTAVMEACAQLREYNNYFDEKNNRERILREYGLLAYKPKMIVIIGRKGSIDPISVKKMQTDFLQLTLRTYDDVLIRAKARLKRH